jgi:NAD(P)-dependent dehydrogenase (short-subunit alcohol dehydrogenase family)
MRFTAAHLEAFARLSHDTNPLHCDPLYAAATPFRQVVVFGVCGVLCALGRWADGRRFALRRLRVTFRKPFFLEEDYDLAVTETGERVSLRLGKNGEAHADVRFTFSPWDGEAATAPETFTPRTSPGDLGPRELGSLAQGLAYAIGAAGLAAMPRFFGLGPGQMPMTQLEALCGSSYLIGMEVPGRQALFSEIDMDFGAAAGPTFSELAASFDPRFNHIVVTGRGRALTSFQLGAFRRPEAGFSLAAVERAVGRSARFAGKTAVVTGSSRGFGAVLTKALALHGANVVVHYREREDCARQVVEELRPVTEPLLVGADLTNDADCTRFAAAIKARFGRVDLLVHSAIPTIDQRPYLDQSTGDLAGYVARALAVVGGPSRALLPSMEGATMVSVSSVYAREPPAGYTHYVAAKGAVEAFTHALATEFPDVAFLVVRPPRMVPDDAGAATGGGTIAAGTWAAQSPADVAATFLARLGDETPGSCKVVDLD